MPDRSHPRRQRQFARRRVFATALGLVFAFGGGSVLGLTIATQQHPAQVALADTTPHIDAATTPSPVTEPTPEPVPSASATRPSVVKVRLPAPPPAPAPANALVLARSKPVALDIPAIAVHSVVAHLGQSENGALEAPAPGPHYNEAAWYRHSPTPGSLGPAIMLGHVDSAAEGPSVFFRLGELRNGNRVMVTRADGSVAVFAVDSVKRYPKDKFPTGLVYNDIDHAGLRIVTCGGAFDNSAGHYLDNVVVFATLIESRTG